MIVMKFGGSSLADSEKIKNVSEIIKSNLTNKPIAVFSAIGKTTDALLIAGNNALLGEVNIELIRKTHSDVISELSLAPDLVDDLLAELEDLIKEISRVKELTLKEKDYLVSFGERMSVRVVSAYLNSIDVPAKFFDGWDAGFITDSNSTNALVLDESYERIFSNFSHLMKKYEFTPIVTGFIGKDVEGHITTFGRGGSDLTASIIGAALMVDEVQFWKDVAGILTADPKLVGSAKLISKISFDEASEMAYFGAKIMHPRSIVPAMRKNIPVRVKNFFNVEGEGTLIMQKREYGNELVKAISLKKDITLVDIVSTRMLNQIGFTSKVFGVFEEEGLSIDMISTSEVSISLTLDNGKNLGMLLEKLKRLAKVHITKGNAIISLICNIEKSSEILAMVFAELRNKDINVKMISQGASKVNIGLVVDNLQAEEIVKVLHDLFYGGIK
ncbi:MAG: aspartate kinase [Candidatus Diapherotrites archaeon CG11_big_fil_rev_8_21_14_0_20_37_9]|nr:MAG: aspartate kinase [Candidatus Diapherotrites archaeon CG11_big_fil_rev_8_21_14_0_20_37_9]